MNNTKQNTDRLAKLALVCLLLTGVSGCKTLAYYVGANSQSASIDHKRDWATRSHVAAYNQAPYFHCCHCGEVVAWGTKHECAPTIAPPFFGHQGTCWRPWPKEWVSCPEQLISEEIVPMMPTPPADPVPSSVPSSSLLHEAPAGLSPEISPGASLHRSPVYSVPLPPQNYISQRVAPLSQPVLEQTGPIEPAPHDASKSPTLAAGVPAPASSEALQSVLRFEPGDRVASRQSLIDAPVLSAPAAASEPVEPEAVKVKTQKPEANQNGSATVPTRTVPTPVMSAPVAPSRIGPFSIEPEIAQSQPAKPTVTKPVAVKPTVAKPTVAKADKPKSVEAKPAEVKTTKEPKSQIVLSEPKTAKPHVVKNAVKNVVEAKAKTTTKIVRAEPKPLPQGAADIRFRSVSAVRFSEGRVSKSGKESKSTVRTARFETSGSNAKSSVKKSSLNSSVKRNVKSSKKQKSSKPSVAPTKSETTKTPQASPRSRLQPVRIQSLDR